MSRARAARGQVGETPLYLAAVNGRLDVVRALLNAGADKTIANNDGEKPIDVAGGNPYGYSAKAGEFDENDVELGLERDIMESVGLLAVCNDPARKAYLV